MGENGVRGRLPRKQGLKLPLPARGELPGRVRGRLPRKQGLKLVRPMISGNVPMTSEGDFHENKD